MGYTGAIYIGVRKAKAREVKEKKMAIKDNIRVSDYKCEICPVCGKEFCPTPLHVYKVEGKKVCSYSCMLNGKEAIPKTRRVRYTVYCPDGYVAKSLSDAGAHMGKTAGAVRWMVYKGELKCETHPIGKSTEKG